LEKIRISSRLAKKKEKMFKPRNFSEKCWTLGPNKVRIMVKVLDNKSIIV